MNNHKKSISGRADWPIPAALIGLSLIPMLAGIFRLVQLGGGAGASTENARFFAAPVPVSVHIVSVVIFCVMGAFQFAPRLRARHLLWHRAAGRVAWCCGLVAALTGLWMTQNTPPVQFDGPVLYVIRLLAGIAMAASLCFGLAAIGRRNLARHRAWMTRAYAIGIGAGTQVITHIPWFIFPGIRGELTRAICMGMGWAINLAVAEYLLARGRSH